MDCSTLKWHTAASLPEPAYLMSATVCGGNLYLLGGRTWSQPKQSSPWRQNLDSTHAVFTCTLDSLLQSCHPPSQTPSCASEASVWQRVTNIPVRGSSCTTLNGRVLAVGGEDSHGDPTALVHVYDYESNSWLVLGNMSTARSWCHVVSLRDCIVTVGGIMQTAVQTATLEVGYLQLSGGGCICSVWKMLFRVIPRVISNCSPSFCGSALHFPIYIVWQEFGSPPAADSNYNTSCMIYPKKFKYNCTAWHFPNMVANRNAQKGQFCCLLQVADRALSSPLGRCPLHCFALTSWILQWIWIAFTSLYLLLVPVNSYVHTVALTA